jgi:hypothetical protein
MGAIKAETKTDREEMLARMDANQAKIDANQERMNASLREEIISGKVEMRSTDSAIEKKMDAGVEDRMDSRKERTACQEATEANPEKMEPNPEMMRVHRRASGGPQGRNRSEMFLSTEEVTQGLASGRGAPREAKGTDPRRKGKEKSYEHFHTSELIYHYCQILKIFYNKE